MGYSAMSTFDDRRDAFEKKHAHDEKIQFKVNARANKLLGQWAAEKQGLVGEAADEYATSVVKADFEEPGREDVFRKIVTDLSTISNEVEIRSEMEKSLNEARQQVLKEK